MLVAWRSDEFDTFDAFEAAAALQVPSGAINGQTDSSPTAGEHRASALNPPRPAAVAYQDSVPRSRVPRQRTGHEARDVNEPRTGGDTRNGLETRTGVSADSRLPAGVGFAAPACP